MKAKDLISLLENIDPNIDVCVFSDDEGNFLPIEGILWYPNPDGAKDDGSMLPDIILIGSP